MLYPPREKSKKSPLMNVTLRRRLTTNENILESPFTTRSAIWICRRPRAPGTSFWFKFLHTFFRRRVHIVTFIEGRWRDEIWKFRHFESTYNIYFFSHHKFYITSICHACVNWLSHLDVMTCQSLLRKPFHFTDLHSHDDEYLIQWLIPVYTLYMQMSMASLDGNY